MMMMMLMMMMMMMMIMMMTMIFQSPVTAVTWGHNDKRLFVATGAQVGLRLIFSSFSPEY